MKKILNVVAAMGFMAAVASTHAATFTVTNTSDAGAGSLREAIAQANVSAPPNTVSFDSAVTGSITLTTGQIRIAGPVSIVGPGAGVLTIDGNASSRIFSIFATDPACPALDGPDYLVSISGLRLANARRNVEGSGGAIFTEHSLTLDSVTIENSMARAGGGISFQLQYPGQALTISNSQFNNNIAKLLVPTVQTHNSGGAIWITERCTGTQTTPAPVTITNSVFQGNRSQPTTLHGRGGAIGTNAYADITITDTRILDNHVDVPNPPVANMSYNGGGIWATAKSLRIERSEISGNSADTAGGLRFYNDAPDRQSAGAAMSASIVNSTVSGNAASTNVGAMLVTANVALELVNSTVSDNTAPSTSAGGMAFNAGATVPPSASNATAPTLTLVSTILANNSSNGGDVATNVAQIPTFTINASNSLIEKICPSPSCEISVAGSGNLLALDPMLGPLALNGGLSRTHALLTGSPAINAGSNPSNLTTDQRGTGFVRVVNGAADMGAYEKEALPSNLTTRYRLYSDGTKEHLYTTDANEYSVLPVCCGWLAEGAIYRIFQGAGSLSGVDAVPYYRLYNSSSYQHHWTTDFNEYTVLGTMGWTQEGIDGYILPSAVTETLPLYRLYLNAFGGLHLWTTDANERNVLTTTAGWVDEGIAGYVVPLP